MRRTKLLNDCLINPPSSGNQRIWDNNISTLLEKQVSQHQVKGLFKFNKMGKDIRQPMKILLNNSLECKDVVNSPVVPPKPISS